MCTCRIAPTVTNTPYELVYRINPDVEHIRTFELHGEGQRVKSDPLIEFGKWVNLMENEMVRTVMFDHVKELVVDR